MVHDQPPAGRGADADSAARAWALVRAAAAAADAASRPGSPAWLVLDGETLCPVAAEDPAAELMWDRGWRVVPATPRADFVELYLPMCSATLAHPITVGHLGQSLDGFIATHSGDSQFVTGEENLRHMHRMRALADAVIVGAGTVAADDPQLTTRQVPGASPLRVVLDPMRRLHDRYKVFQDGVAPTLYVCTRRHQADGSATVGQAEVMAVDDGPAGPNLVEVVEALRARGCARLFVEGGGVTVSAFLASSLLDRLHVAVAPFLIGAGRPAIRLPAPDLLRECLRPAHRVFRMGTDVLFDCDLSSEAGQSDAGGDTITRVL